MRFAPAVSLCALAAALAFAVPAARAQTAAPAQAAPKAKHVSLADAEALAAPIALYPDRLLAQVLIAATYPAEVVQAVRWMADPANAVRGGQDLIQALDAQDWDPSIKALTAVPQVLRMMDSRLDWTERLGNAFVADQASVMDAVQALRRQARASGNLVTDSQRRVIDDDGRILIEPAAPQVAYIQLYTPPQTYGVWQNPAQPPVYFPPPDYGTPLYQVPLNAPLWDLGVWDWPNHRIRINQPRWRDFDHHHDHDHDHEGSSDANGTWHHDPTRRLTPPPLVASAPVRAAPKAGQAKPFVDVAHDGVHAKAPPREALVTTPVIPGVAPHPEIALHQPMHPLPAIAPETRPILPPTAAAQAVHVTPAPAVHVTPAPAVVPGAVKAPCAGCTAP